MIGLVPQVYAYIIFKAAIWLVSLNFAGESWSFYARNSAPLPIERRKKHSAALRCRRFKMAAMVVQYRATTGIRDKQWQCETRIVKLTWQSIWRQP
jgi:hypothetical protein